MQSAETRLRAREMYNGERVQDAFSRFEMLERRVDIVEGNADAMALGNQPKTLEQEFAELQSNDKVEAELAALKAAHKKEG
jgi:phage shock protein A